MYAVQDSKVGIRLTSASLTSPSNPGCLGVRTTWPLIVSHSVNDVSPSSTLLAELAVQLSEHLIFLLSGTRYLDGQAKRHLADCFECRLLIMMRLRVEPGPLVRAVRELSHRYVLAADHRAVRNDVLAISWDEPSWHDPRGSQLFQTAKPSIGRSQLHEMRSCQCLEERPEHRSVLAASIRR
ncbi:hypothetical protein PENSPDRAFT_337414 [Peniophora sp. CONT]|nr:hypothetical protein PENSPDRAFT_337414 [Peniophora sp. CONT]